MEVNINFIDYLNDLKMLIAVASVKGQAEDQAPYGTEVKKALDCYLNRAKNFGFHTFEIDHKVGVVEYGSGEEELAIFVHIDVVPAEDEESWRFPPFLATEYNGSLYGRGTLDDKGPALAILYALAALKKKGVVPKRRIRIVIGCDEESGMDCMATYKAKQAPPTIGFTPDGYFPVTYSEKGILVMEAAVAFPELADRLTLSAGKAQNVEPRRASAVLVTQEKPADNVKAERVRNGGWKQTFSIKKQGDEDRVIFRLLESLLPCLEQGAERDKIREACELLKDETGQMIGIESSDDHSGALTMQATKLRFDQGRMKFTLNVRYPSSADAGKMKSRVASALADKGFTAETIDHKPPICFDPEKPFIKALTAIYQETTTRNDKPMSISGGTYARAYPDRVVAFGALFPGEPLNAHAIDENVKLSVMKEWLKVYEKAMEQLADEYLTP